MRSRARKIFSILTGTAKYSIRKIAELTGIPKSSSHRHAQAAKKRNLHPESHLWETEEGHGWLCRLFYGAIIIFGLQCGIGAGKLSSFFIFLRLDKHIGVCPSTIRNYCTKACELLEEFQEKQEERIPPNKSLKMVGGVDETYFEEMILVLMDLASGYLFVEEKSEDKSYETWLEKAEKVAEKHNIDFKFFVSDRAKQLIKLATDGFNCLSIPDLFHASHELVKLFGLNFNRKKAQIQKELAKQLAALELLKNSMKDTSAQEILIKELKKQEVKIEKGMSSYHNILHKLSLLIHPFNIEDSSKMVSAVVLIRLYKLLKDAEELRDEHNITSKKDHLKKFKNQVKDMASLIDAWWLWVDECLQDQEHPRCEDSISWLKEYLLPKMYWENQAAKTKDPDLKENYLYAFEKAQEEYDNHPLTSEFEQEKEMMGWAKWMVSNFQRTSSAVEGRNGWLSQMHHNGRGLSPKRLKALTVLHNYYLKRIDGTTAAERAFRQKFPDPLEWVVGRLGGLPHPRESKKAAAQPPGIANCPALWR